MPETRVVIHTEDGKGQVVEEVTAMISDEQLANESEEKALSNADALIDSLDTLAKTKTFLKRLCKRLVMKGSL